MRHSPPTRASDTQALLAWVFFSKLPTRLREYQLKFSLAELGYLEIA